MIIYAHIFKFLVILASCKEQAEKSLAVLTKCSEAFSIYSAFSSSDTENGVVLE
jgi:hypothetical protein